MFNFEVDIPSLIKWETVQAYAETRKTRSLVACPASIEECIELLMFSKNQGLSICPRGGGFTLGDMILNDGQVILNLSRMNKILRWDEKTGQMIVEPGVQFMDIFQIGLLYNWTLNSCPGGMGVTIGGAISNNVHGKDSWKFGNFGDQVLEFKLLTSSCDILVVDRENNKTIFDAVIGGMGLLGIVVEATIQLNKVPSAFVDVSSVNVKNIEEIMEVIEQAKEDSDFSVAWVDAFSTGNNMGRGFVTTAKWIDRKIDLAPQRLLKSLTIPTRIFGILPARPFWFLTRPFFRPWSIRLINKLNYSISQLKSVINNSRAHSMLFTDYNFMHNKIPDLKHVYRPHGFLEFQPLFPRAGGVKAIEGLFRLCQHFKCQSLLCGVKSHRSDDYLISYSGDGYSIGVDIQIAGRNPDHITRVARAIFEYTLECGGKTFLAKDELLPPDIFKQMYPRYKEFLRIKKAVDPLEIFQSDMYRRIMN